MNVWNKVLYCLIAILCVAFSVLAANKYALVKKNDADLAKMQKELAEIQESVATLKAEIYGAPTSYNGDWRTLSLNARLDCVRSLLRGATFSNCRPVDATAAGAISFAVSESYDATAFHPGALAYVFDSGKPLVSEEENADGSADDSADAEVDASTSAVAALPAKFLGAFKIEGVNGTQTSLTPADVFSAEELAATTESAQSGRSWIVCLDRMPIDSPNDLAAISQENPEAFALYGDAAKAFFAKKIVSTLAPTDAPANVEGAEQDAAANEQPAPAIAFATTETAESRYPIDFQGLLDSQQTRRNAENTLKTRNEITLARFTETFFDQLVAIDKIDEAVVAKADEQTQALYSQEGYQERYDAALQRKASPSFAERQTELIAAVEKMHGQRDLVKTKLDEALAAVERCRQSIAATLEANENLAAKLARVQILVAEKIERESASRAAASDANFSYSGI